MTSKKIDSIDDILDLIENMKYSLNDIYFRGQRNGTSKSWDLKPSFYRSSNQIFSLGMEFEKEEIYKYYEKYHNEFSFGESIDMLSIISVLQHHGFPTRLLDITENPLSALFFALNGATKEDNPVLYLICSKVQKLSHFSANKLISQYYDDFGDIRDCILINGKITSERIKKQQGDFILMFEEVDMFNHKEYEVYEYEISVKEVEKIKNQLLILGYGEKDLYPSHELSIADLLNVFPQELNSIANKVTSVVDNAYRKKKLLNEPFEKLVLSREKNNPFSEIKIKK